MTRLSIPWRQSGTPRLARDVHTSSILTSPPTMVSTRRSTKVRQVSLEDDNSGDRGKNHGPEEGSGPLAAQRPKPRASGKAASKQKGKRCNAAKLSKLPDMPLDVLYEVSYRIVFLTDDTVCNDAFGVCRFSLLSTRWIYCGCRGPAGPFVTFSQASRRDRFGKPLSTTYPKPGGHLHVPRT